MIITDNRVARFVGERCGTIIYPPYTCLGVEKNGAVIGGAIFNCFTGQDVEMTVAGEASAFTRQFYHAVRNYVFKQMGCLRISVTTESEKVIELAKRLGAQVEGRKRDHFGKGRDGIVLGILEKDWKI